MRASRLTIGSLFSGIGGLEFGLERAGLGPTIWQVRIWSGTKVATNVAMVTTRGEYTGRYGASVRWFGHDEVRCSDED